MRTIYTLGMLSTLVLLTGEARPCGGAFGASYQIEPAQQLVVSHRDGIETYVFNPKFCGKTDSFGLILPVPAPLTSNPTLGAAQLYTDLMTLAAPTIVKTKQCMTKALGGNSGVGGASAGTGVPNVVTVIQRGQVGIFDWALLKANNVGSFTDWLTVNGYPYQSNATTVFKTYVDSGWYFVAFKVSASGATTGTGGGAGNAGSAGSGNRSASAGSGGASNVTICGSFGPVGLAFPTPNPVIPARIAAVSSSSLSWDIFAIAAQQMRIRTLSSALQYSGAISDADMAAHSSLAKVARAGDRLTELLFTQVPSADIELEPDPNQADYRRVVTQIEYVQSCTGGSSAGGSTARGSTAAGSSAFGGASGANLGGSPSSGGKSGGISTGGTAAVVVGGSTGGAVALGAPGGSGGVLVSPPLTATGGRSGTGVAESVGGVTSSGASALSLTGGNANISSSSTLPHDQDSSHHDDSGCALEYRAAGKRSREMGLISIWGALGVVVLRRRRKR